jgi:hypothetical protein
MKVCKTCKKEKIRSAFYLVGYRHYRLHCKECVLKRRKKVYNENKDKISLKRRTHYKNNIEKFKIERQKDTKKIKALIIKEYGGKCVCKHGKKICGEKRTPAFLTIDHINGKGNEHRRKLKRYGSSMYYWLKQNNFPKDEFQLLCCNCNFAKSQYKKCPLSV